MCKPRSFQRAGFVICKDMLPGDIISLPLRSGAPKATTTWYDAKCLAAEHERFSLEFISGPQDGHRYIFTREELDSILERNGGEGWKK